MRINSKAIINYEEMMFANQSYYLCKYIRNDFDQEEWQEFINYERRMYFSEHKKEHEISDELYKELLTDVESDFDQHRWLLLNDSFEIVGRSYCWFIKSTSDLYENNKYDADMFIDVDERFRNQKLGSLLIEKVIEFAKALGKKKLQSSFSSDYAKKLVLKHDFSIESERFLSELKVENIDHERMKEWTTSDREVLIYEVIPDEILEEYCKLYTQCGAMAPDYEGDFTASEQLTPKSLRAREKEFKDKKIRLFTAISREKNGVLSGLTELDYGEGYFTQVDQGLTGVLPKYRGNGIGKLLKASLLLYILEVNPKAKIIHTANNNKNYAMLEINKKMGFKKTKPHYLVTKKLS